MSASFVHQLFRLWNRAAATELDVRIQGPLLSFPFGIHYRIVYIDWAGSCGLPCRGWPANPIHPAYVYPGPLDLPTNPKEQVLDKYLECEYKQLGKKPAWVHDRDNATEVNTYSRCPSAAPGLEWESVWAQYWFNQHHHLQPRPVLRWHPRDWPQDAKPFKKLRLKDCTDRPYFGLHPEIAALFLDLTARVKGTLVHDGLFHPSTPLELQELCRQANTVNAFKP